MFAFILKQRESSTTFRKQTETSKQFSKKKNKQTKKLHQQKRKISHSYHLINQVNKNWTCTSIKECFFGVFVRLFFVLSDQSYLDHTISEVNIGSALIGIIDLVHPFFCFFFCWPAGRPAILKFSSVRARIPRKQNVECKTPCDLFFLSHLTC